MGKKRKILKTTLSLLALATLVGTGYNWRNIHMVATYNPIVLPPMYGEPDDAAQARLQDLRYLRKLPSIDRSFTKLERTQFTKVVDNLVQQAANLSDAQMYLGVSKAVAIADNGHTNTSTQPLNRQFNKIPAKLYWFADGLYIVRAKSQYKDIVGKRIIAIEGRDIDTVSKTLSQYRGGAPSWRKLAMPMMMESPQIMHAAGLAEYAHEINFTLEGEKGQRREIILSGKNFENKSKPPYRRAWESLLPQTMPDENDNWLRPLQDVPLPLYLRKTENPLFAPLAGNGHYIRTKTGFGTKEQPIPAFFEQSLMGIDDGALDYLVVDYRWNSGGNYLKSIDFAKHAPSKIKDGGKLYLLVGPNTFSASIVTVAMLKHYGGDKAIIVGTPMGDHEQFWAERGMSFKLPNSKLYVNYATGYHDWERGCKDHKYCFTFNRIHGVAAGTLLPSMVIESTYADYNSGRDVVLDKILSDQGTSIMAQR